MRYGRNIIIGLSCLFFGVLWMHPVQAARLTVSADSQVTVGQTVTATVRVDTSGAAINAAEGTLTFPTELLTVKSVSKSGTIFSFWALEPKVASGRDSIGFIGGLPHPGYTGSAGTVFHVTFTAAAAGKATVQIIGGKVLADDGQGTDILSSQGAVTITIAAPVTPTPPTPTTPTTPTEPTEPTRPAPVLTVPSIPTQQSWANTSTPTISWSKPSGFLGASVVVDQNASTIPGTVVTTTGGQLQVTVPSDGIWYVHVRAQYPSGWGPVTTYMIRRDTTPPTPFTPTVQQVRGSSDPSPKILFTASDATSGVGNYLIAIDGGTPVPATSPYTLKGLAAGSHTVTVTAIDEAGNKQTATTTLVVTGYPAPIIEGVSSPIMLLDTVTVHGTAQTGDVVELFLDGKSIGQVTVGKTESNEAGETVARLPWTFTSAQIFAPGHHALTARALSSDGQESVTTDPVNVTVVGQTMLWRGRPVATIAVVPAVAVGLILIVILNAAVYWRLWLSTRRLFRREVVAEEEIEELRQRVRRDHMSAADLDTKLRAIEAELDGQVKPKRQRRSRGKRSNTA